MSYILDALRRADAEREREGGAVPTLHAQARPAPGRDDDDESRPRRPAWLLPGIGALGLVAVIGAGWVASRSTAPETAARAMPPVPMPVQPAPVDSMPAPPAANARPAPPMPMPAPAPRTVPPVPPPAQTPNAVPRVATQPPLPARPAGHTAGPVPAQSAAPAASAVRLPRQAELPDAIRREIPTMAISGSIFSPERRARMVIVNGQVRREGEAVAPGLVIEEIRAKTAVFTYKGQRFEVLL